MVVIGFFYCDSNNMFKALTQTSFLSCNYSSSRVSSYSGGVFISENNIRRCIALFSARSLPKHTWINEPDTFIGKVE